MLANSSDGFYTKGAWGPVTATLDFCETNYQFSHYVAEMANTFSNVFTMYLAFQGIRDVVKQGLPSRYIAAFLSLALVGAGSLAFHATLLHEAQLADELPMIYSVAYGIFLLSDRSPGFDLWTSRRSLWTLFLCFAFCVVFTWSYWLYRNPVWHQVVFAVSLIANTWRGAYVLKWSETAGKITPQAKKTVSRLMWGGVGNFLFGFLVWNLDTIFCDKLTVAKHFIGWPSAFLLEGHSWWHFFTAFASYQLWTGIMYLTLCTKDDQSKYTLAYRYGYFPYVKRYEPSVKTHDD